MKDLDKLWVGLVEENVDPDRLGRVKVRVQSIYDDISVEDIPWAHPIKTTSGKSFEIPAIGKIVSVFFPNDNLYEPYYMYAEHYNVNLQKKLNDYSDDEYPNFTALVFDHKTKVFSDDKNLTMDYLYNRITIDNDNINLELKDNSRKVNLGTKSASQQAVLGNHFFDWLDKLIDKLVEPTSLIGNMGAPVLKPEIDLLLVEYKTLRETFLSDHVYIVDDFMVDKLPTPYNSPIVDDGVKINATPVAGNNPGATDVNNQILSDKIKVQKEKELETLKTAMPSEVKEDEQFIDLPEEDTGDDTQIPEKSGVVTEYKEVKNGEEKIITKEQYDQIKNKELEDSGLITYETIDWQEDADFAIYDMKYKNLDPDLIVEYEVYKAPDDTIYTDVNENISAPAIQTASKYNGSEVTPNCKDIVSNFNPNYKITPSFTLGQLAGNNFNRLIDKEFKSKKDGKMKFISKYQIACNLKSLAENILEPLLKAYPDMRINSTIRNWGTRSEHETGQAADLRFINTKRKDYIIIAQWIKNNLPYNQLFLEYRPSQNVRGGWIHVSYANPKNVILGAPRQVSSLYNDKSKPPGVAGRLENILKNSNWIA